MAAEPGSGVLAEPPASITCPRCGLTSHHPMDVWWRYCANCSAFHADLAGLPAYRPCGLRGCRIDVSRWPCAAHRRTREEV